MKKLSIVLFLIFSACSFAIAQFPSTLLKQVRQIKLLESTRDDVKRILAEYNYTHNDDHYQRFSNDSIDILVTYSSGTCSEDPDEEDDSEIWKTEEWKVTRIQVTFNDTIKIEDLTFDLSKLVKEQKYAYAPDLHIYHDKGLGLSFETNEEGIEEIIFYPPSSTAKKLCVGNTAVKDFYSRKSWFSKKLEDREGGCINLVANVVEMNLSAIDIEATSKRAITVTTVAVDPENDVLTYNYTVSAGQITGYGAKVVWDLAGVAAGTYTITAGVDDGCGLCGKTMTKTVIVK